MPIQGEVKVVGPKNKRKQEPKVVEHRETPKMEVSSELFVIKDSKYHQDMFNRDLTKSN